MSARWPRSVGCKNEVKPRTQRDLRHLAAYRPTKSTHFETSSLTVIAFRCHIFDFSE